MRKKHTHLLELSSYGVIAVWTLVAAYLSAANPTIGISDMFVFIPRAESLTFDALSPWVNGFYPFGYPLLLKALSTLVGDYVVAGRAISLLSGVIGLIALYHMSRFIFTPSVALIALLICGTNPAYMRYSTISGTDMPAAALLMLGLYFVCRFSFTKRLSHLLVGGTSVGAAYLIRYTSLTMVPAVLLWFWLQPEPGGSWKQRFHRCLWFLGGFILVVSPQLVLSSVSEGHPFYNLQATNVYFGMFGGGNWGLNMPAATSINSLSDIILEHPRAFVSNWYHNVLRVPDLHLVQFPLGLVSFAGLLFAFRRPQSRDCTLLVFLMLVAYTAAICMAFPDGRLLLFCTMPFSIFAAFGFIAFFPTRLRLAFPRPVPVRIPCVIGLTVWLMLTYTRPRLLHPVSEYDRNRINVSEVLASQGIGRPSEVLAFSFDYYDMTKPTKDRFAIPWYSTDFKPYGSVNDLALRMKDAGQRFLVFDSKAPQNVRGLSEIWPFDENDLGPSFDHLAVFSDSVHIYRLREMPNN